MGDHFCVQAGDTEQDRRERPRQRAAVAQVIPEAGEASLLRTANGEVLVFEDQDEKRRPVNLRAVVLPDGDVRTFEHERFKRR